MRDQEVQFSVAFWTLVDLNRPKIPFQSVKLDQTDQKADQDKKWLSTIWDTLRKDS